MNDIKRKPNLCEEFTLGCMLDGLHQTIGNEENPQAVMMIQHTGVKNFRPQAQQLVDTVEKKFPNMFLFHLNRDKDQTGSFEVFVYRPGEQTVKKVHSRLKTNQFPRVDMAKFFEKVINATKLKVSDAKTESNNRWTIQHNDGMTVPSARSTATLRTI